MSDLIEEWRPIAGYEGRYDVSNLGRVRSLRTRGRDFDRPRPEPKILKLSGKPGDYQQVQLGHRGPQPLVHALVLEAFVGPRPSGMECAHGDGRKDRNRLDNLRWATKAENEEDKVSHGTLLRGEAVGTSKLTSEQASAIKLSKRSARSLADEYGVTPGAIKHVRAERNWKHV